MLKNKKAFAITSMEIVFLALALAFGVAWWLTVIAIRNWVTEAFSLTTAGSIWMGIAIMLTILFIVKYRLYKLFPIFRIG